MDDDCPIHPKSPDSSESARLTKLSFDIDPETQRITCLSATLQDKVGTRRTFRFSNVLLSEGGSIRLPDPLGASLAIYDISSRQWDGPKLAVEFATSYSEPEAFWAESVTVVTEGPAGAT